MGNYRDMMDARMESDRAAKQAEKDSAATTTSTTTTATSTPAATKTSAKAVTPAAAPENDKAGTFSDPYGSSSASSQSVRRRGSTEQQRVGQDSRVREDASSGTAGASGGSMGAAMSEASGAPQIQAQQNVMWQATRQPTDLASIQQRVLQSLTKPMQRG